jgi:hypothetical protein
MNYTVLPLNDQLAPEAAIVLIMLAIEIFLLTQIVPRRPPAPTVTRMIIGSTALLGSAGLLMALTGALLSATLGAYSVVLLMFNFMMLGPPGLWMIAIVLLRDRRIDPGGWPWPVAVAGTATFGEAMMGLLFVVASGGPLDVLDVLAGTLSSAWFLWAMAGAMLALLIWLRFAPPARWLLGGLIASAVAAPFVTASPPAGAALMVAAMTVTFVGLLAGAAGRAPLAKLSHRFLQGIAGAFLAMTLGGLLVAVAAAAPWAVLAFGAIAATVMTGEFVHLVGAGLRATGTAPHTAPVPSELPGPPLVRAERAP